VLASIRQHDLISANSSEFYKPNGKTYTIGVMQL
jgi:hypothetical protein